jgi:ribosomal protein S18 acetylase RimI-like enzyme
MPVEDADVHLSPLDTNRFGIVTARADAVTAERLDRILEFCEIHEVELLVARSRVEDSAASHALGAAGFLLMDTLVYYERDLVAWPIVGPPPELVEPLGAGDADEVEAIARECFREYSGHYHADPRLDRTACTEVYASWARACCDETQFQGFALVVGDPGNRVGFSSFRRTSPQEGELLLGAVLPTARGRGLYRQLTTAGMHRLQATGATRFITSTHLSNWGAQAAWTAAGLRPYRAFHTFHRWFER